MFTSLFVSDESSQLGDEEPEEVKQAWEELVLIQKEQERYDLFINKHAPRQYVLYS